MHWVGTRPLLHPHLPSHKSDHSQLHPIVWIPHPRRGIPLWRQTCILTDNLLPMPLPPGNRQHLPRPGSLHSLRLTNILTKWCALWSLTWWTNFENHTHGRLEKAVNFLQATSWQKKKHYESGWLIIVWTRRSGQFSISSPERSSTHSCIACPQHFATGAVYHLLSILRQAPEHGDPKLYNQDLAGFSTNIDQQRFLGAWHMLLDFLRPHIDVSGHAVFSVYPGRSNNLGDLIKGRTCRRLNVTRKITGERTWDTLVGPQ